MNPKIKVGDKIRTIVDYDSMPIFGHAGFSYKKGEVFKVEQINEQILIMHNRSMYGVKLRSEHIGLYYLDEKNVELVKDACDCEMSQLMRDGCCCGAIKKYKAKLR